MQTISMLTIYTAAMLWLPGAFFLLPKLFVHAADIELDKRGRTCATTSKSGSTTACKHNSMASDGDLDWRASYQLRRRLFASFAERSYDRRAPPTRAMSSSDSGNDATTVSINMDTRMLSLELVDDAAKILAAVIYVKLTWRDPRLTWNPQDFANLTNIDVSVGEIWLPSLRLLEWSLNEKRSSTSHTNTRWFANDHARISRMGEATQVEDVTEGINKDYSYGQWSTAHYAAAAAGGERGGEIDNENPVRYHDVRLNHTGTITFSGFIIDEVFCPSWNIYHFPFDKQACLITLYLPRVTLAGVSPLSTGAPSYNWTRMQMTEAQISGDWYDSSIFVAEFRLTGVNNDGSVNLRSDSSGGIGSIRQHVLLLERMPAKHVMITVVPAVALTIFAIIGCFLACERNEMYGFSANIIASLVLLYIGIDNEVPIASQNFPVIGYYYLGLLCISFVALVLAKSVHVHLGPFEESGAESARVVLHSKACQYWRRRPSAFTVLPFQQQDQRLPYNMYVQVYIHEGWRWFFFGIVCAAFCLTTAWACWQWSTAQWPIDRQALLSADSKSGSASLSKTHQFIQSYLVSMM